MMVSYPSHLGWMRCWKRLESFLSLPSRQMQQQNARVACLFWLFFSPNPMFAGIDGGLSAITQTELAEDVGDVVFHRTFGDEQPLADLAVIRPTRQFMQDLVFTLGQFPDHHVSQRRRSGGSRLCGRCWHRFSTCQALHQFR